MHVWKDVIALQEGLPNSLAGAAALITPSMAGRDPPVAELDPPVAELEASKEGEDSPQDHSPVEQTAEEESVQKSEAGGQKIVVAIPIEQNGTTTNTNTTDTDYEEEEEVSRCHGESLCNSHRPIRKRLGRSLLIG